MDSSSSKQAVQESAQDKTEPAKPDEAGPAAAGNNAPGPTTAPLPKLQTISPVFSTADLERWLDHYRALGFNVKAYGDEYGFARLDGVEIQVAFDRDHDPAHSAGCAYVSVDDADALRARWSTVEGGRGPAPVDTDYGMREGGHIDPDGNLIRYGSRMKVEADAVTGGERP